MPTYKLKNDQIRSLIVNRTIELPKYASSMINSANRMSQATRPKKVGQMSELINEFPGQGFNEWAEWYQSKHPDAIQNATDEIMEMITNFRQLMPRIDENMVREWVEDLILVKTFTGLKFQEAVFKYLADLKNIEYRKSTPEEESQGIDGYLDNIAYSIKPESYSYMDLLENMGVRIIYYKKNRDGIEFEFD